jgi:hypothetical protein
LEDRVFAKRLILDKEVTATVRSRLETNKEGRNVQPDEVISGDLLAVANKFSLQIENF